MGTRRALGGGHRDLGLRPGSALLPRGRHPAPLEPPNLDLDLERGCAGFALVVVDPALNREAKEARASLAWLVILLVAEAAISVGLWSYFAIRTLAREREQGTAAAQPAPEPEPEPEPPALPVSPPRATSAPDTG